jgi:hypothetical protein
VRLARLRPHLSYANVVASIALFVALGGGAYAAITLPKNSVGSKQIKRNAVNGKKVKNLSLSGADINLSKLGKVPSAREADRAAAADSASLAGVAGALAAPEAWHEVGTPGEPPFESGAGNHLPENGFETVGFFKDHEGVVHLKGEADPGPSGIFELPPGYRPPSGKAIHLVGVCRTCPAPHLAPVNITGSGFPTTNGRVAVDPGVPMISLDGITFRAAS